ncbi:MAG: hypothetical protein WED83_08090 [Acidimicrobiia bacterium]
MHELLENGYSVRGTTPGHISRPTSVVSSGSTTQR